MTCKRREKRSARMRLTCLRINNDSGASLAELLMTVVLIGLVTAAMAAGIAAAQRVYKKISLKADAQTLLATTVSALTLDLSSASSWDAAEQAFLSEYRGYKMKYVLTDNPEDGKQILGIENYSDHATVPLLPSKVQTRSLYAVIKDGTITLEECDDGSHYFYLTVEVRSTDSGYTKPLESEELCIHNQVK